VKLLSILMPVYNECRTLHTIVRRVLECHYPIPVELIAIDDGSKDDSLSVLRGIAAKDLRVKVVCHAQNMGKGAAIHTGIQHMSGDIAIIQDADLEYDPQEIARVIQPILNGKADAVYGSRFAGNECRRVLYYWHSLGNGLLTWVTNVTCDLNLTDMETCYKAVRADILRNICLRYKGFALEPELTVRLAQWGVRLYEVPISYAGRTYAEGKKIDWRDGIRALGTILWCRFFDTRFTSHEGYYTLVSVRRARRFNRWLYRNIRPYVGQRVLEAGCGIGNLTNELLNRQRLVAVDLEPVYVEMIERRFSHLENFRALRLDLANDKECAQLAAEDIDTVICLNVLEHIAADGVVLQRFHEMLQPGGHAIILVPQHPWLYTSLDQALGHARRYLVTELRDKLTRAGFEIVHEQGFNKLGTIGWFLSGKVLRRTHLSPRQMRIFDWLTPLARLVERLPGLPALSAIAIGRKPH
jgi:glycosyltransferase involved in cell wall biosynthesis